MQLLKMPPWIKVFFRHIGDPVKEFTYLFIFALMPIWLGTIIHALFSRELLGHLEGYLFSGEALLISAATVGPLFYAIMKDYDDSDDGRKRSFPGKHLFIPVILLTCLISAAILGVKDSGIVIEKVSQEIFETTSWWLSAIFSVTSVLIWFAVTTIRNSLEHAAPQVYTQDTSDFVADWNK